MTFNADESIKFIQRLRQKECRQQFAGILQRLPHMVGRRHDNLPKFCRVGLGAGLTDEQVYEAIMTHCGQPKLGEREVRQAIEAAKRPLGERGSSTRSIMATEDERIFVPRMIKAGQGTTVEGLQQAAHLSSTSSNRSVALCRHIQAIIGTERFPLYGLFFVGTKGSGRFMTACDLINRMDLDIEPHIIPNALTGEPAPKKDGTGMTLRGDNCVVAPKLMLIEFDSMAKEEQLAFVGGVLKQKTLRLDSVVDSGNKSLHILVEVEGGYTEFRERVLRLCCSARDSRYHADRAVLHASALTRLAGAIRPETGRVQELVWAASC